jgi:hypothetical protein
LLKKSFNLPFLKGHEFTRAAKRRKISAGFSRRGMI